MLRTKPGEIIRNKRTRKPYLVIFKNAQGLFVVDLTEGIDPAKLEIILPRASAYFEPDKKFIDLSLDEAETIKKALPLVDSIQDIIE